jgi:hypothetical protein
LSVPIPVLGLVRIESQPGLIFRSRNRTQNGTLLIKRIGPDIAFQVLLTCGAGTQTIPIYF